MTSLVALVRTFFLLVLPTSAPFVAAQFSYQLPTDAELTLTSRLNPTFSCDGRPYGYYADQDNNCEIFHICLPIQDQNGVIQETLQYSFACPNTTMFDQASLICNYREYSLPCAEAASYYGFVEFGLKDGRSARVFDEPTGGDSVAFGPITSTKSSNSINSNNNNFVSIQELPFLNPQGATASAQGFSQRRQTGSRQNGRAGRRDQRRSYWSISVLMESLQTPYFISLRLSQEPENLQKHERKQ